MKKFCLGSLLILQSINPLMATPGQETPQEVAASLRQALNAPSKQTCLKVGYAATTKKLAIAGGALLLAALGAALYVYAKAQEGTEHNGDHAGDMSINLTSVKDVQHLVARINRELCNVREVVVEALEHDSFDQIRLSTSLEQLKKDKDWFSVLETWSPELITQLQEQEFGLQDSAHTIQKSYRTLVDEAGALDLWVQGYDAYMHDLEDNFKHLPNDVIAKPDFTALYQELGFADAKAGKEASFKHVQEGYAQRSAQLKAQVAVKFQVQSSDGETTNFCEKQAQDEYESKCFTPYLRVLGLIFRTAHHKHQYDAFLAGNDAYNAKGKALSADVLVIKNLFERDLPDLAFIAGQL